MSKKVLIVLAEGFEEIEAVIPVDVLRRAGLNVTIAGVSGKKVAGAHNLGVETDIVLKDYKGVPDAVILPGGLPGSENLAKAKEVAEIVKKVRGAKKLVCAICAAPALALAPTGVLDGKRATCYPGFEKRFPPSVTFSEDRVVVDGNVITSRGPGSAFEFALELVAQLAGKETAEALRQGMLVK